MRAAPISRRRFVAAGLAVLGGMALAACGKGPQADRPVGFGLKARDAATTELPEEDIVLANIPQTGFTTAVPADYLRPASQQGTVVELAYDTHDYANDGAPVTKTCYVYLPFGYDEGGDVRYDVLYLMHGWGGHAGEYFEHGGKELVDQMIERGNIRSTVVVSPSFYGPTTSGDFSSSVSALRSFHKEFKNDLMPAVEGAFRTYAKSTSPSDLAASRDHRAFGGFSLGSVTTWMAFCHNSDYIRYFLPMSGSCWYYGGYGDFQTERNVDLVEQLVTEKNLNDRGYFIYFTTGTQDSVRSQSIDMANEMLARPNTFTPNHFVFYQKDGGHHDLNAVREYCYNALPLFFPPATQVNDEAQDRGREGAAALPIAPYGQVEGPYTANTPIGEVRGDTRLGNAGRLLFPADSGYMSGSTLGTLALTWYDRTDPQMTVDVCNYVWGRVLAEETAFIDIYSSAQKATDPAKADTGLFFFKGEQGAPTAIVSAGGGFAFVGAMQDSFPHCMELARRGYNAFALIYRPGAQTACEDLARSLAYLHEHASELGIGMEGYSLWGGSAGARMAGWLGAYGTQGFGEPAYPRPAACIVNYTGLSEVTGNEPPTYSAVGTNDWIANYRTMQARIERIRANGTPAQIEVFPGMPHGFGLGTGTVAEGWLDRAVAFWEANR